MEIQDGNNLLRQFVSIGLDNTPKPMTDDKTFADMLKPQDGETNNVEKLAENFSLAKEKNVTKVKEKTEMPMKEDKKEAPKKKTESQQVKESPAKEIDKRTDGKKEVRADNENTEVASTEEKPEEATSENATTETVKPVENTKEVSETEEINDIAVAVVAGPILPLVEEILVSEETVSVPVVKTEVLSTAEVIVADEVASQAPVVHEESLLKPLTEEEALLLEQAKYLDNKLSSTKVQIEVSVQEEKIAEPVVKDVLQNRFEIDSLFQTVASEMAETAELPDMVLEVEDVSLPIEKNIKAPQFEAKGIAFAEAHVKTETVTNTATIAKNDTVLAVSGKEVVLEASNTARSEAFAKINETSSRDMFRGMGKEVIEQIKVNITKSAVKGIDTIDIQLKPEELGKIQIKMHIAKDGRLQAEIISARAETLDILQKDVSGLAKAFNDAGYDTDSRSFNFSFQEESQAREQQKDESGLLRFIGDTLEQEAEALAGNDNLGYDPLKGLNIKV